MIPGVISGRRTAVLLAALLLASCTRTTPPPDRLTLTPVSFAALPGWNSDHQAAALPAFLQSCAALLKLPDDRPVGPDGVAGTVADWRSPCAEAAQVSAGDDAAARRLFETVFRPFKAANNDVSTGLFTGYYEPELRGARERRAPFTTPLLKRPPDLVTVDLGQFRPAWRGERIAGRVENGALRPYAARAEIEAGALAGKRLELLYVDDPIDAFFLQIQGSGRVVLPDGSIVRVGYDGQNGQPYVPVGRLLVERGALSRDEVSLQSIRAWMRGHPGESQALMAQNPSYVFFRELSGDGPLGAQGVALTPERSLAVDRGFVPLGVPVWLDAEDSTGRLQHLLVAQDTGGAIRGPVRGDVFWGHGPAAEERAGHMKARGEYYLLLPRALATRPATIS